MNQRLEVGFSLNNFVSWVKSATGTSHAGEPGTQLGPKQTSNKWQSTHDPATMTFHHLSFLCSAWLSCAIMADATTTTNNSAEKDGILPSSVIQKVVGGAFGSSAAFPLQPTPESIPRESTVLHEHPSQQWKALCPHKVLERDSNGSLICDFPVKQP